MLILAVVLVLSIEIFIVKTILTKALIFFNTKIGLALAYRTTKELVCLCALKFTRKVNTNNNNNNLCH